MSLFLPPSSQIVVAIATPSQHAASRNPDREHAGARLGLPGRFGVTTGRAYCGTLGSARRTPPRPCPDRPRCRPARRRSLRAPRTHACPRPRRTRPAHPSAHPPVNQAVFPLSYPTTLAMLQSPSFYRNAPSFQMLDGMIIRWIYIPISVTGYHAHNLCAIQLCQICTLLYAHQSTSEASITTCNMPHSVSMTCFARRISRYTDNAA